MTAPISSLGTALLAVAIGSACGREPEHGTLPVDLFRQLEAAPILVLSVDDPELESAASGARERLVEEGWRIALAGLHPGENPGENPTENPTEDQGTPGVPRIRVGGFDADWAGAVAERLGWTATERQLTFAGRSFRLKDTLLVATLPDPEQPGLPLTVVLASTPGVQAFGLARVRPGWRPSVSVWWAGDPLFEMPLTPDGRPRLDQARDINPARKLESRRYSEANDVPARISGRVAPGVPQSRAREVIADLARTRGRVDEWLPQLGVPSRVARVVLEPTVDRMTGYPIAHALAFGEPWPERVLGLVEDGLPDDLGAAGATLWLTEAWDVPAYRWIAEGAAYERADRYWGRELEAWAAHLLRAGLLPGVEALVRPELARALSVHQRAPGRAMLVRYLLTTRDVAWVERVWKGGEALELTPDLKSGFQAFLTKRLGSSGSAGSFDLARRGVPPMRGAAFTNTFDVAERRRSGWGTGGSRASLEQLARHGANAVTLPCFFSEGFDGGTGWPLASAGTRGALDGDVAIALAVAHARQVGLRVVLIPEYLSNPSGTWRGELKYLQPEAWEDFFEGFGRCVTHFALLAELLDVDVFSVGSGMPNATRTDVEAEAGTVGAQIVEIKRAGWKALIARARGAYGGALTYSAQWPSQAHGFEFWEALDCVGAAVFPALEVPVDLETDPSLTRQVASQLRGVWNLANDLGKPALITEIGFRSTERALLGAMDAGGDVDEARQAELLDGLALGLDGLEQVQRAPQGLFLWKWPSSAAGGGDERGYSPAHKAGEASLKALFQQ